MSPGMAGLLRASSGRKVEGDVACEEAAADTSASSRASNAPPIGWWSALKLQAIRRRWNPVLSFESTQPWLIPSTLWPWCPSGTFVPMKGNGTVSRRPAEHGVHVVDELPGNAVLVRRHAEIEGAHRPLDRGPVERREAGADPERARPEPARGRGEEGRLRIVLLDQVLEPEEVLPGRGKKHALRARDPVREGPRPVPLSGAHELPRAVPAHRVLKEGPGAVRRRKGRLRVPDQARRGPGRELRGKRPPIEAVVRADAGVVRDQLAVADENAVDQLHG